MLLLLVFKPPIHPPLVGVLDPTERKKEREVELSNSHPLSHWTALMVRSNCVDTQAKKWRRVGKVSDLARQGKVQE